MLIDLPSLLNSEVGQGRHRRLKRAVSVSQCNLHARVTEPHDVQMAAAGCHRQKSGMLRDQPSLLHPEARINRQGGLKCAVSAPQGHHNSGVAEAYDVRMAIAG